MKIVFPDGSSKDFPKGSTGLEIAKGIGERLAMAAIAVQVDGVAQDLNKKIEKDCKINILTFKSPEGVEVFRHSSAHILGAAVTELFPKAKPTIGPAVEQGFYYDFAANPFTPEDLEKINKKMEEIVKQNIPFERIELTKADAKKLFKDNKYKLELIDEAEGNISAYKLGKFTDLCRGPHVPSTSSIKAIKTTKMGSAYWKGDSKNDSLQRIYGISFTDKKDLDNYFKTLETAEQFNHSKIGEEMHLFAQFDLVGKGLPIWLPKGDIIRREIEEFAIKTEEEAGYVRVGTPNLAKKELFIKSGHLPYYKDSMYPSMKTDDGEYYLKAMNCPQHHLIFSHEVTSYRQMPYRIAEYGTCYRNELSGTFSGLLRVRSLRMNDAHIYCTKEQVESEVLNVLSMIKMYYDIFKLTGYSFRLSLHEASHKEKYIDDPASWKTAEDALRKALNKLKLPFVEVKDEAAFYGPKIDIQLKNIYGREETMSTVQLDFAAKKRFNLTYDDEKGAKNNEVFVIHRAPLSTHERFIAFLIEQYKGKFPLWLNPVQVKVLPIADRHLDYANKLAKAMKEHNIRAEVDTRVESTPKKVYDAQMEKVNYILVVGDKEIENATATVRKRDSDKLEVKKVDVLIKELIEEIKTKKI